MSSRGQRSVMGAVLLVAILLGGGMAFFATRGGSEEQGLVALIGSGPTGESIPVDEALEVASEQLGFPVLRPRSLPTSADELSVVEYALGPEGVPNGRHMAHLMYRSAETHEVAGAVVPAAGVEIFQVRGVRPGGEPAGIDVPGYEVWRETTPPSDPALQEDPRNTLVTYTAVRAEWSFVITFRGEQPTEDGLRKMILSFE